VGDRIPKGLQGIAYSIDETLCKGGSGRGGLKVLHPLNPPFKWIWYEEAVDTDN